MGVKLVINENEILQNGNVSDGDFGTVPIIPSFITSIVDVLDTITYDPSTGIATTTINLNQVLIANKSSDNVLPFH